MPDSADELVTEFCAAWAGLDPALLARYFADDGIYHNMPMAPVQGRADIQASLAGFIKLCDGIDFVVVMAPGTIPDHQRVEAR